MQAESNRSEVRLSGTAASPGVARGPAYVLFKGMSVVPCYEVQDAEAEIRRLEAAISATRAEITLLRDDVARRLNAAEAAIFDAHLLVLEDVALIDDIQARVRSTRLNIEHCFKEGAQHYIEIFENMKDGFLRERAADIRDVTGRVLDRLIGAQPSRPAPARGGRVLVARELTPSDTAGTEDDGMAAFVTEEGGRTSHSAIMARALGIPSVVGVVGLMAAVGDDDAILVDGEDGLVIVNPSAETLEHYRARELVIRTRRDRIMAEVGLDDVTADGDPFVLQANIGGPEDMDDVASFKARGVGLYRTENLCLRLDRWPTEEEQHAEYAEVVRRSAGAPVTFRTLDLGGDKRLGALEPEDNPFMGFRAVRLCLAHPEIFRPQLRAIIRAAALGPVSIMFPMISGVEEMRAAKAAYREAEAGLAAEGVRPASPVRLGAMIEIPSAVAVADRLARECDFFSVGTNDLVQYLLAVDRGNQKVASLYDPCHPAVVGSLRAVFTAA
ncbi:MAG: phosphoenolpyruvate--protein phosphotransferase, partial [Opitutales bacterium]